MLAPSLLPLDASLLSHLLRPELVLTPMSLLSPAPNMLQVPLPETALSACHSLSGRCWCLPTALGIRSVLLRLAFRALCTPKAPSLPSFLASGSASFPQALPAVWRALSQAASWSLVLSLCSNFCFLPEYLASFLVPSSSIQSSQCLQNVSFYDV